jgi:hypothetical protein
VDASLTESPRKPKGKITCAIAEDRDEDLVAEEEKSKQTSCLKKQQGKGVDPGGVFSVSGTTMQQMTTV